MTIENAYVSDSSSSLRNLFWNMQKHLLKLTKDGVVLLRCKKSLPSSAVYTVPAHGILAAYSIDSSLHHGR